MLLLLTLPFIFSITAANKTENLKIVNGRPATIFQFPYQVAICYDNQLLCGGSILSEKIVISAAHCLVSLSHLFTIQAGMTYFKSYERRQISKIQKSIIHPKYKPENSDYDMSLVILKTPFVFNAKLGPIGLPRHAHKVGELAIATGWGNTKPDGSPANMLQYVQLPLLSHDVCNMLLYYTLTDRMLCAGYIAGGYDTCQGDSGGPLSVGNELVGVTSWGFGCANPGAPGVYTNVYKLVNWIYETADSLNLKLS